MDFNGPLPEHHPELGPCWLWTAATTELGYGWYRLTRKREVRQAHRYAYERTCGPIPPDRFVCHHCDRPGCVNPTHLWLGTAGMNNYDKIIKGRAVNPPAPRGDEHRFRKNPESVPRGSKHASATITEETVLRILETYAAGGITQAEIAAMFDTNEEFIGKIVRRERWKHVEFDGVLSRSREDRHAHGERCARAKLTEDEVRAIRRRYAAGGISQTALGNEYGLHNATINAIVNRATWKHVPD